MSDTSRPPDNADFERFKAAMRRIVRVPKTEIEKREKAWKKGRRRKR